MPPKQRGRKSEASLATFPRLAPQPPRPVLQPPEPPADLGVPEQLIWQHIFEDYSQTTRLALNVLHNGLLSHQLAREAQAAVERDGLTITGAQGQTKSHPLLPVVRDARAAWFAALKTLGLEL